MSSSEESECDVMADKASKHVHALTPLHFQFKWKCRKKTCCCQNIRSQPITDDDENVRHSRQLDLECCPCTGPRAGLRELPAGVDDCPCRLRDADSQGSASFFLPRALRPLRPDLKPSESKEDHKPLLHPEVDLASSVLETLRAVTDEEYEDAVARDAARSAAKSSESEAMVRDSTPETAKNIVTIILNPKSDSHEDELVSEASNVQEAHIVPLLGSSSDSVDQVKRLSNPQNLLKEIFNLPKLKPKGLLHSVNDMDSGASNVQERVFDNMNKGLHGLKLRSNPQVMKLFPSKIKPVDNINKKSSFKLHESKSVKSADKGCENSDNLNSNVPDLRFNEKANPRSSEETASSNTFNNPLISRLRSHQVSRPKGNSFSNLDNGASASNVAEQLIDRTKSQQNPLTILKTLKPKADDNNITKRPFDIKNLLKLRDVELIPPKSNKAKITIPGIKLTPTMRSSHKKSELNNFTNERSSDSIELDKNAKESETNSNVDLIAKDKSAETKILDAVPSPSENHKTLTICNDNLETSRDQLENQLMTREKPVSTQILDAMPSPSENHHIATVNENNLETNTDQSDADSTITVNPIDSGMPQFSEETNAINTSKNPEDSVENIDFNESMTTFIQDENLDTTSVIENAQINQVDSLSNELNIEDSFEDSNQDTATDIDQTDTQIESEINNVDLIPDSVPDTSNDDATLILLSEEIDNNNGEPLLENSFRMEEPCQNDHQDNLESNTTPVAFKANARSNKNTEISTQSEINDNENSGETLRSNENVNIIDCQEEDPLTTTLVPPVFTNGKSEESTETRSQVNLQDLQELSNSLLDLSNRKKQDSQHLEPECETTSKEEQLRSSEVSDNETENTPIVDITGEASDNTDLEASATSPQAKLLNAITYPIASSEKSRNKDNNLISNKDNSRQENNNPTNMNNANDGIEEKVCLPDLHSKNDVVKTRDSNVQTAEMTAESSSPVINIVPQATSGAFKDTSSKSSLLQDIVMQPSSVFGENDLFRRPLPDFENLLNLNTQLPTLDDIQSSLSNMIGGNERQADEEELSSTEIDNSNDCSNSSPVMSTGSSTTNSKTVFPVLKPLQNMNLDILQINPLSQARVPSLNLNSYKTKLALPKFLQLKPIELQSSLGKNGGLLGATLTFGPDKIGVARNSNPSSNLNRKGSGILQSRLGNIPRLDDLRSTMKTNAENLLKSPLTIPGDTLRSGQISALSDNLRFHTANTMKNIQQTLASTLNEATVKGDKFAKPQDFLEMVSTAHDDATDKLQAIHTDLTDRLTSLHESIVDQSNLPSLQLPMLKETRRNFNTNLQRKPTSVSKIPHNNRSQKARMYKANTQDGKLSLAQARTNTEPIKLKPYKISKAASTLTPKSVEVPKLTSTQSKPSFSRPLQRDSKLKLKESKPTGVTREPMRSQDARPVTNKLKPFGESRVKVTISTTARPTTVTNFKTKPIAATPKPRLGTKTSQFANGKLPVTPKNDHIRNKPVTPRQHFKPLIDSKGFASEVKPSVIPPPVKPNSPSKPATTDIGAKAAKERSSQLRQNSGINMEGTKPKPPLLNQSSGTSQLATGSFKPKPPAITDGTLTTSGKEPSARNIKPQPLVWPKVTDDAFLTKVREALRARFSNLNANKPTEKVRTNTKVKPLDSDDMLRSASENKEVALVDETPLKENVSYRCKMVCVREPIEP